MCKKKHLLVMLVIVAMVLALGVGVVGADEPDFEYDWAGYPQGSDSEDCSKAGEDGRPDDGSGWIHWLFNNKGDSTDARIILYEKADPDNVFGVFEPWETPAENWHFYTPYFDLETLGATVYLYGGEGATPKLVIISDYCPGVACEDLEITKTVVTTYNREHDWCIDKKVFTDNEYEIDCIPKIWLFYDGSGDECATWRIRVWYNGFEDKNFNVSGTITIENTGTCDAVITSIVDLLAGTAIDVDWVDGNDDPVDPDTDFPYTLEVGEFLYGTYSEDVASKICGDNVVTVTTETKTYDPVSEPIVWGAPENELYSSVQVTDTNDGFAAKYDTVILDAYDQLDAEGEPKVNLRGWFTYDECFFRADYNNCESHEICNIARLMVQDTCGNYTIVFKDYTAKLKINVQCGEEDSAWAKGSGDGVTVKSFCQAGFANWGWTNQISYGEYEWDLWAGAAQCDTSKGTLVGTVMVDYSEGSLIVNIEPVDGVTIEKYDVYAGTEKFPRLRNGRFTTAPGQYSITSQTGSIWVIVHADVVIVDPNWGPPQP